MNNTNNAKLKLEIMAKRLKKLRKDTINEATNRPYSQELMAEQLGMAKQTYCDYENGISFPKIETLFNIANYFDVDYLYLLGDIDAKHVTVDAICKETGLTEEAVETLQMYTKEWHHQVEQYFQAEPTQRKYFVVESDRPCPSAFISGMLDNESSKGLIPNVIHMAYEQQHKGKYKYHYDKTFINEITHIVDTYYDANRPDRNMRNLVFCHVLKHCIKKIRAYGSQTLSTENITSFFEHFTTVPFNYKDLALNDIKEYNDILNNMDEDSALLLCQYVGSLLRDVSIRYVNIAEKNQIEAFYINASFSNYLETFIEQEGMKFYG